MVFFVRLPAFVLGLCITTVVTVPLWLFLSVLEVAVLAVVFPFVAIGAIFRNEPQEIPKYFTSLWKIMDVRFVYDSYKNLFRWGFVQD